MDRTVTFEIPKEMIGDLYLGKYKRIGGVIRDADSGKIVTMLKETHPDPRSLGRMAGSPAMNILSMAGSSASILNLGATVAFGVATLKGIGRIEDKLAQMDQKLDVLDGKLDELMARADRIQWSVDIGFARTLQAIELLGRHQEIELMGEMNSAANMAWSCQFLEPGSGQRVNRIENAFHSASGAKEKILLHAKAEMGLAVEEIAKKRRTSPDFCFDEAITSGLMRVRQAVTASALAASIAAEADDLYTASAQLTRDHATMNDLFSEFMAVALQGHDEVYPYLLRQELASVISSRELEHLVLHYDDRFDSIYLMLDHIRQVGLGSVRAGSTSSRGTSSSSAVLVPNWRNLSGFEVLEEVAKAKRAAAQDNQEATFFQVAEGITEELDRLHGYSLEYKEATSLVGSMQEYRELTRIDEIPENEALAFITPVRGTA